EAGVHRVFKLGGAQAIAAMAYGTETVPAVEKIVGPGNLYVNLAKRLLWGTVGVDLWAGPSEAVIIAEPWVPPEVVAAEMLTQLEHGSESVAYLLTPNSWLIQETIAAIEQQLQMRTRAEILQQSLRNSYAVHTESIDQAVKIANAIAPEHLALMVKRPLEWLPRIENAGCILLGTTTPQAMADYLAGPSHTLPTGGAARFESPISVETFFKRSSVVWLSSLTIGNIGYDATLLAREEGFDGHAYAIELRSAVRSQLEGD
ncbi:MAG: histidinol dehydrogenase, partial [Armatimonadota bacterium]|nr:histidinol dehydrogenase [Armatimonadota bacterium]